MNICLIDVRFSSCGRVVGFGKGHMKTRNGKLQKRKLPYVILVG